MSAANFLSDAMRTSNTASFANTEGPTRFHRISTVRRTQGMSIRRAAGLLGITIPQAREEEDETVDLPISRLLEWQRILEVPLADLVWEESDALSAPILHRARLLRIMKTVMAISDRARDVRLRRLVTMLGEQLREAMPELAEVRAWPEVGKRRTSLDVGRAAEQPFSGQMFGDFTV